MMILGKERTLDALLKRARKLLKEKWNSEYNKKPGIIDRTWDLL